MRFIRFIPEIIQNGKLAGSQLVLRKGVPVVRHDLVARIKLGNQDYMVSLILEEDKDNILHLTIFIEEIKKGIQKSISLSQSDVANCVTSLVDTRLVTIANTITVCGMGDLRRPYTRNDCIKSFFASDRNIELTTDFVNKNMNKSFNDALCNAFGISIFKLN